MSRVEKGCYSAVSGVCPGRAGGGGGGLGGLAGTEAPGVHMLRADGGEGGAARPGLWANWLWATVSRGDPAQGTEQAGARSGAAGPPERQRRHSEH